MRSTIASTGSQVLVAGVPWPLYKLLALGVGLAMFVIVAAVTISSTPAVLAGALSGTLVWLSLGLASHPQS